MISEGLMSRKQCQHCRKEIHEDDDNETLCFRCERVSLIIQLDEAEYEELDINESRP